MKREKRKIVLSTIILLIIVEIIAIIVFSKISFKKNIQSFMLPAKPQVISSNADTTGLAVVIDGQIYLYDANGDYKKINTDFNVSYISYSGYDDGERFKGTSLIVDDKNNLYEYYHGANTVSDVILTDIASCSASWGIYGAVTIDGKLYMWGNNEHGQLGVGKDTEYVTSPMLIDYVCDISEVACGFDYTLLKTTDGNVFETGHISASDDENLYRFTEVLELKNINSIYSRNGSVAIAEDGTVAYWHYGFHTSFEHPVIDINEVNKVCNEDKITQFSLGSWFNLGLSKNGQVYYWNWDIIKKGYHDYVDKPTKVAGLKGCDGVYVSGRFVAYASKGRKVYVIRRNDKEL